MRVSISASCAVACMCEIRKEADPRRYDEVRLINVQPLYFLICVLVQSEVF